MTSTAPKPLVRSGDPGIGTLDVADSGPAGQQSPNAAPRSSRRSSRDADVGLMFQPDESVSPPHHQIATESRTISSAFAVLSAPPPDPARSSRRRQPSQRARGLGLPPVWQRRAPSAVSGQAATELSRMSVAIATRDGHVLCGRHSQREKPVLPTLSRNWSSLFTPANTQPWGTGRR